MTLQGNFFEDFDVGKRFRHPTPRTLTEADASLHIALTGARQPLFSSEPLARSLGYRARPLDDALVFNMAFGKTVRDISANAIANLGYADLRFLRPVFAGDTLSAESEVIGLREASSGDSGVVYVRSGACNQDEEPVLTWARWVLVRKRDKNSPAKSTTTPALPDAVPAERLSPPVLRIDRSVLADASGSDRWWEDFRPGQRIDHPAGLTIDESDHTLATKLYQNNAKVHFDALSMRGTAQGRRLVYGGHVISVCRALSYEGLENVLNILAINGGTHRAPTFAGDTLYCFTEVLQRMELPGRDDLGALRLRLVGVRNHPAEAFEDKVEEDGKARFHPDVVLDLDYTVSIPKRGRESQR